MISALAGLPSLGGMGGGFDGSSLPMLGFGLLSTLSSSLTTGGFLGIAGTSVPNIQATNINFGNFNSSFGSYSGASGNSNSNGYFYNPNQYGDNPSLHTGPSDFRAWHQWATGGVQPPLEVAPFYGQGYAATNVQFNNSYAYGAAGAYGAQGGYGAQAPAYPYSASPSYGAATGYAAQPIFSNAYRAMGAIQQTNYTPVPNYTPVQNYTPVPSYNPPSYPTTNYTPTNYTAPAYTPSATYGSQPTPEQTSAFSSWAQSALSQFNATGSTISGSYQSATGQPAPTYAPAAYNPPNYSQPPTPSTPSPGTTPGYTYGTPPTPQQTAAFSSYAQQALAQLNATAATIQGSYQASSSSSQASYGSDITYSLPASQPPSYASYTGAYQSLPTYQSAASYQSYQSSANYQSYGAYNNVGWSYPQPQPPVFYGSALPSYAAPVLQSQTPYGYGGPPQPAPVPPPAYPPRPPYQQQQPPTPPAAPTPPAYPPVAQQPPVYTPPVAQQPPAPPAPPAYPPVTQQPPVYTPPVAQPPAPPDKGRAPADSWMATTVAPTNNGSRPARLDYPRVPIIQQDVNGPASVLASRLVGDPSKISSFTATSPPPNQNKDALHFDRVGAYTVMQQDSSLRYNVDTGRFFRTYDGGTTKDVLDMAQVSQMLRQDHPDNYNRVGRLLQHLPTDGQLFGSQEQAPPISPSFTAGGATQVSSGFVRPPQLPPVQIPNLPPLNSPTLPPFAGFPNSGGKVPALDALVAQREAGQISGNDFNLALLEIAGQQGISRNPQPPSPGSQFQLTAHRYWDPQRGDYANVTDVTTQGYEGQDQQVFNTLNQHSLTVTREGVPDGTPVRVTINWDNGQSRVWDYQVANNQNGDVDVFSPIG